jgi:hypothetical protein
MSGEINSNWKPIILTKIWVRNNLGTKKNLGTNKFGYEKHFGKKKMGTKKIGYEKNLGTKKNLVTKTNRSTKKYREWKKWRYENYFGTKTFNICKDIKQTNKILFHVWVVSIVVCQVSVVLSKHESNLMINKKQSETGDAPQRFFGHNIALYIQIKGNVLRGITLDKIIRWMV